MGHPAFFHSRANLSARWSSRVFPAPCLVLSDLVSACRWIIQSPQGFHTLGVIELRQALQTVASAIHGLWGIRNVERPAADSALQHYPSPRGVSGVLDAVIAFDDAADDVEFFFGAVEEGFGARELVSGYGGD